MIYVLTHTYGDRSASQVCGVTMQVEVAQAWFAGSEENDVIAFGEQAAVVPKELAPSGWRTEQKNNNRSAACTKCKRELTAITRHPETTLCRDCAVQMGVLRATGG